MVKPWTKGEVCLFHLQVLIRKAVALRAVIGTNLHGEGSRALCKRTAISLWSSFLGWGHLWALIKIWTTPSFYRKKDLSWFDVSYQPKDDSPFLFCLLWGFFCVYFIVWVCIRGLCASVWGGFGFIFLSMHHELSQRLDFGPCLQEGGGIRIPKKAGSHEIPLKGLTQRLPKHQPL